MSRDRHPTTPGRRNLERRTSNVEPRTSNLERRTRLPFAVACLLLAAGPVATAQEAPSPEPTPLERSAAEQRSRFDYGGFAAPLEGLLPTGSVSRWTLTAGLGAEYSDNANQDSARDEGFRVSGLLGAGWVRRSPRLTTLADYRMSSDVYQTGGYDGQSRTRHELAGTAEWLATQHLRVDASGYASLSQPEPFEGVAPGVRAGYGNRTDSYGADLSYDWQLGRVTTNHSYYSFSYTSYLEDEADGDDTVSHLAGTELVTGLGARDRLAAHYDYRYEESFSTDNLRHNHMGGVDWRHTVTAFPAQGSSVFGVGYQVDRGLYLEGADYWSQSARATYAVRTSPRTDWSMFLGYQWIDTAEESVDEDWIYGLDVTHRFSPRTTATLGAGLSYAYLPSTSVSEFTQLTKSKEVRGTLDSQLARTLRLRLNASYLDAGADERVGPGDDQYWTAGGGAELSGGTGEVAFWGVGYLQSRRQTEDSDDDYHLFEGRVYLRRDLFAWLSTRATYRHTRRYYDVGSTGEDYFENLAQLSLTGRW